MADAGGALKIGGSLVGGLLGSSSAKKAASAQAASAQAAVDEQRRQYDLTRSDLAPWRNAGVNALGRLQYLLGLGPANAGGVSSAQQELDAAQSAYNALASQRGTPRSYGSGDMISAAEVDRLQAQGGPWRQRPGGIIGKSGDDHLPFAGRPGTSGADPAALAQAQARIDAARAALAQAQGAPAPDNAYGSLMRDFGLSDFEVDPGYQFRLSEGQRGLENSSAARGMQLSGANLKALNRFNQGFASNEFLNAYNRDAANKARKYNFLGGVSGGGQAATNTLAQAGQNTAGAVGNLLTQQGNARAAGIVGSSNALQGALGGVSDYLYQKDLLDILRGG